MAKSNKAGKMLRAAVLSGVSLVALGAAAPVFAQDQGEVVVVKGVRGSLARSMNIKKNATGIVDAISAEDMGKYPDTNLAESVQRITGVSINRVNGEGSEVTVRGFGPGFNLVTLNGRVMPTANIAAVGGDQTGGTAGGGSRNFDFSNIASDGVSGFEVYKTGKAHVASGGIGATLNIKTLRPIDKSGSTGSITVKALHGDQMVTGKDWTPEVSGAYSWANADNTFGIAVFGAYSERDFATRSATSNAWNIETWSSFSNTANGRVNGSTTYTGAPSSASALVSYPNDSRYHFSETHTERTNLQATAQWRPAENWLITADFLTATTEATEQRNDQTNWFNRPFGQVTFEAGNVNTAVFLAETLSGVKDIGFEQQMIATKDTLTSIGLNAEWRVNDKLTITFDGHSSKGESLPNNSNGSTTTAISIGAPVVSAHSVDWRSGVPVQAYTVNDCTVNTSVTPNVNRGNCNNRLDAPDLGSQVARTWENSQTHEIQEFRADGAYDFDGQSRFDFGVAYRNSEMNSTTGETYQALGDWGISRPGDVNQYAGSLITTFCMSCLFTDYNIGNQSVAFRGDAVAIYDAMRRGYNVTMPGRAISTNFVTEKVMSAYGQATIKTSFVGMPASIVAGLRYEKTEVESSSLQAIPTAIRWTADNDFARDFGPITAGLTIEAEYDHWLPNLDFSVNLRDNLIARASFSKTIARAAYGSLYSTVNVGTPPRPTALGVNATATTGDPSLLPLESSNVDFSLEWYYGKANYVSVGFYNKDVNNFLGSGVTQGSYFGLRDPSSGAAGSRSGSARTALTGIGQQSTDVNLFTMTALIVKNNGDVAAATTEFQTALGAGTSLPQSYVDTILAQYDITANSTDPLFVFDITRPVNNKTANLHGFEFAGQHFFGDTGFGIAGSLTTVEGDVEIVRGASPSIDQFALLGLSDTYNVTFIYDKGAALSGRLSYNWRDEYLAGTNRGGSSSRNPVFIAPYGLWDVSVNYQITPSILLTFEGLNLTGENIRSYGRDTSNLWFAQELDSRYQLGVRYRF